MFVYAINAEIQRCSAISTEFLDATKINSESCILFCKLPLSLNGVHLIFSTSFQDLSILNDVKFTVGTAVCHILCHPSFADLGIISF